ncbi:MAG: nucleotidyltransferase family protein [Candidatus Limnocylindrales bacterium]
MSDGLSLLPLADVLDEARRIGTLAQASGVRARLLGGCGVALHAHREIPAALRRTYGDLDYVVRRSDGAAFRRMLEASGYEPNARFNALHGHRRTLHYDPLHERQVDTFVGDFAMCHALELRDRLPDDGLSLAPVDLLLTKLQIVEVNDKDLVDVLVLLVEHAVDAGPEAIDPNRLAAIVGRDWGWYTTLSDNLEKLAERTGSIEGIEPDLRARLVARIEEVRAVVEGAPRSLGWRARAVVGRRMPWYELPEEVAGR